MTDQENARLREVLKTIVPHIQRDRDRRMNEENTKSSLMVDAKRWSPGVALLRLSGPRGGFLQTAAQREDLILCGVPEVSLWQSLCLVRRYNQGYRLRWELNFPPTAAC